MRYWYDTEFLEDGRTIDLISIGIVAEDGRELYLVNHDANWRRIRHDTWLMKNVIPGLPKACGDARNTQPRSWLFNMLDPAVRRYDQIGVAVREFLLIDGSPELWAWYAAYDHVALCQLWGRMVDLPAGIPMWTNDIQQQILMLGNPPVPEQTGREHNALDDARYTKALFDAVMLR